MNAALVGGLLGGLAAVGLLLAVAWSPPMRKTTLADRIAPYVGDARRRPGCSHRRSGRTAERPAG